MPAARAIFRRLFMVLRPHFLRFPAAPAGRATHPAPRVAASLALPAMPQETQQPPVIRTQVSLVNLFVTVRDKSKRIVTDLKQDDFKVAEDNQPQQIAFFSKEVTRPFTRAMLRDTSGSEKYRRGWIQYAGTGFGWRGLRKGDEP